MAKTTTRPAPPSPPTRRRDTAGFVLVDLARKAAAAAAKAEAVRRQVAERLLDAAPSADGLASAAARITETQSAARVYGVALSHLITAPAADPVLFDNRLARVVRMAGKELVHLATTGAPASSCASSNALVAVQGKASAAAWVEVIDLLDDLEVADDRDAMPVALTALVAAAASAAMDLTAVPATLVAELQAA